MFPGLSSDMLFVVASIGSGQSAGYGRLAVVPATSVRSPNGVEGRSTLQLHQPRLIPDVQGFLMTSVVLPPDSEIVAPFSVSGVRLGLLCLGGTV